MARGAWEHGQTAVDADAGGAKDGVEFEVALSQQSDPTRRVEFDCADAHLHRAPTRFAKAFLRSAVARPWVATG